MEKAVENSLTMLKDMSKMFIRAKINTKSVQLLVKRLEREDIKASFKHTVHSHLCSIYVINWSKYEEAWALVDEETWEFYDMMGFEGHKEQDILADAIKALKIVWKDMPKFKRDDHVKRSKKRHSKKAS